MTTIYNPDIVYPAGIGKSSAAGGTPIRTWHSGPPPHVGWWNASVSKQKMVWRWWDGSQWSSWARPNYDPKGASWSAQVVQDTDVKEILWSDYWPEGARVPRVDPSNEYVIPLLPAMNAGNVQAWRAAGYRMQVVQQARAWTEHALPGPSKGTWLQPTKPFDASKWELPTGVFSTGQCAEPVNPEPRDLANQLQAVSTRELMVELFKRLA